MSKCKKKAIQADLGKFRHNQTYPGIIPAYSEPCVLKLWYIRNQKLIRTLAYSQPWYIQNSGTFRTLAYSKSEADSELCQTSTIKRFAKIVNGF